MRLGPRRGTPCVGHHRKGMRPIIVQRIADFVNQEVVEHLGLPDCNHDVSVSLPTAVLFKLDRTLTS